MVNLRIRADGDPQAVAIALVRHVADEDLSAFQLLVNRLDVPIGVPAPDKIGLARADLEAMLPQLAREPLARRQDAGPRLPEILLIRQGGRRRDQAERIAVIRVLYLDQLAD